MKVVGETGKPELNINKFDSATAAKIKSSILKYGYLPQHHFELFLNYARIKERCVFLSAGRQRGIFCYRNDKNWRILNDPLCPEKENSGIMIETLDFIFGKYHPQKIILEDITENLRKKLQTLSKNKSWRVLPPSYSLSWPVLDLKNWMEELPGKKWKRFRKIRNKFFRENKVIFKKLKEVSIQDLKKLVTDWKKRRNDSDRVHLLQYMRFLEEAFTGFDLIRIMEVNGKVSAVNGGWRIPKSQDYYSIFGLHDYNLRDIGEVSYLDELASAKKMGFEKINLGGSSGGLLEFKKKFHPDSFYQTDTFSVMPR